MLLCTIGVMAYDEALAGRIRDLIGPDPELTEKKMFGGLSFLIRERMAITASRVPSDNCGHDEVSVKPPFQWPGCGCAPR